MNAMLCRLFGHRWDYRITFVWGSQIDTCSRCGVTWSRDVTR